MIPTDDSETGERVPCIEVLDGRSKGRVFPLERRRGYVIGRLPGAEIHIDDPGVSRRHVKITLRSDGAVDVADMRSTNGLIVNGEKLERGSLQEGDLLSLGPDAILRLGYRAPGDLESVPTPAPTPAPVGRSTPPTWSDGDSRPDEATLRHDGSTPIIIHPPKLEDLPLSARQLEVSRHVAAGLTNAAIAEVLGISPRTVTSHLDHIYGRLGIGSRAALTRWIVERGLVEPL